MYLAFCQWHIVNLDRQTGYAQHLLPLLVVYEYIVNDDPVQEPDIYLSYSDLGAQLVFQHGRNLSSDKLLHAWQMEYACR